MIARAALVPIAKRLPFFAVRARTKNFAFGGEDEIRANRKFKISETGFEKIDGSAGVDRPDRPSLLQFANQFQAIAIENRLAHPRNHRAVKIETEKFDFLRVQAFNLGIDLANATREVVEALVPSACLFNSAFENKRRYNLSEMKSAYELAMERLAKNQPVVTLTDDQKKQLAEIDSQFKARIAEKELFLKGEIAKAQASGKFEELESLEKQLRSETRRLQEDCETKKEKLRASFSK